MMMMTTRNRRVNQKDSEFDTRRIRLEWKERLGAIVSVLTIVSVVIGCTAWIINTWYNMDDGIKANRNANLAIENRMTEGFRSFESTLHRIESKVDRIGGTVDAMKTEFGNRLTRVETKLEERNNN